MIKLATFGIAAIVLFTASAHAQEFDSPAGAMLAIPIDPGSIESAPNLEGWNLVPLEELSEIRIKWEIGGWEVISLEVNVCLDFPIITTKGGLNDKGQTCDCDEDGCRWVSNH